MTDSVCDSWEDVDVEKIVIKPSTKKNTSSSAASSSTAKSAAGTSSFIIEENGGSIVVNSNLNANASVFEFRPRNTATSENRQLNYAQACRPSLLPTPPTTIATSSYTASSPFDDLQRPRVVLEDDTRTQFVPRLRILNRPNADRSDQEAKDALSTEERNKALLRSFEEKRAEYAKARLRILGEEMPREEVALNLNEMKEALDASTTISTTTPTPLLPTPPSLPLSAVNTSASINIIRQPTAPDGTRGFNRARS